MLIISRTNIVMKKTFLIFFTFAFSLLTIYAQSSITWNRLYDGGFYDDDYGYGLCQTTDGNFVLGGYSPFHGAMVLKINSYGNTIWRRHYTGSSGEAITATNDGGVVLASPTFLKINSQGDTVWLRSYPGNGINNLYDVIQCSDGGYFTCGRAYYDSGFVMKTDSFGNFLWKQIISDTSLIVRLYAICEDYSNGCIVAGMEFNLDSTYSVIAKFNSNGERIWIKTFDINMGNTIGNGVRIIKEPPYYLIACKIGYMKIDDLGNVIKSKRLTLDYSESIFDLRIVTPSKFIAVTQTYVMPVLTSKIRYIDTSGVILNTKTIDFSDFIRLKKIEYDGYSGFICGGDAARYDTSQTDFYALRCDSNLNFPPIKVKKLSENLPSQFKLYQNFPNPFNPKTTIKYDLPKEGFVIFKVDDVLGKELYSTIDYRTAGTHQITLNGTNYASGLYFYRIESGNFTETKKMVLIK